MEKIVGGVTAPKGFEAAAAAAELKYKNRNDMALIYSTTPCKVAGTFTTNVVKAAPVIWCERICNNLKAAQAIVANSGIANACTGKQGLDICEEEAAYLSSLLNIPKEAVLIGSTGVIGRQMPLDKLKAGMDQLVAAKAASLEAGDLAAKAIMTTDTVDKQIAYEFTVGGRKATIGAMCKGSGMIHPNMCTMLAFITTDVCISEEALQKAVKSVVVDTFNMVSVDGDTSTNDTMIVMANGQAENKMITLEDKEDYEAFYAALEAIATFLAKKMAGDGEGATALFEATVVNAATKEAARILAKSVVCSSLSKAAIFGHDCNFGRFLCALGYAGVSFDPEKVDLFFEGNGMKIQVYGAGTPLEYSEEEATQLLSAKEVTVLADMHQGEASATAWGCDLSYDYVKINADYRS